jgi:hypothetical protein
MTLQPAAAAHNGKVYLAWNNSTSLIFGDPAGKSNILFLRSEDGGKTWGKALQVNPNVPGDLHHVLPSLTLGENEGVSVSYYTQHGNGTVDLDVSSSDEGDGSWATRRVTSTSFTLPPTNIPIPTVAQPYLTTNYDRQIAQCYALGEYQSITSANGQTYAAWGDMRNQIIEPVNALDPISGQKHSQEDVFFQQLDE